jgi:hypothetical protein
MKAIDRPALTRAPYSMRYVGARSAAAILLALFLSPSAALPQPRGVSLVGRVVDADNDRPLRRAMVSMARQNVQARAVLTDEDGRFAIDLSDPSIAIVITKAGYASTVIEIDRRTPARELDVRLRRGAAISGRLLEQGQLAIGARVLARRIDDTSNAAPTYQAEADDLGEYRIGGLPAGQYIVTTFSGPQAVRVTSGFFSDREAVPGIAFNRNPLLAETSKRVVDARAGQETADVDFTVAPLQTPPEATAAAAQSLKATENDPGAISGRVITPSGQPVGGALIMVSGNNQSRMVIADRNGQFDAGRFTDGDYKIETGKYGYLTPEFRPMPESQTALMVRVGADTRIHDIDVVLARGGAIAGTIVDSAAEPFQGVLVRALRLRQQDGRALASSAGSPRLTDDRGRYRLFGLPPGTYLVVATLDAIETVSGRARARGFAPVYYPSTAHVESAQAVPVEFDAVATGIDLTFAVSSTARVIGRAVNAVREPLPGRVALMVSARSGGVVAEPRVARIERDGSFSLADIPPGDYVLHAIGERGPGVAPEFGAEYITVGEQDAPPLTIRTTPGATLEGRFVAEGRSTLPLRAQVLHAAPLDVDRSPPDGRGPEGLAVHDDGRFYLTGLFGPMRLTYPAPSGWYLKAVTIGGVDVTDRPFDFGFVEEIFPNAEVVLSNAGARITGSVADAAARRATEFVVLAFSTNRADWFTGSRHLKRAVTGANGSFDVDDLPPGEYFIAAIDALPRGDWQSPEALDLLVQRAERVTLTEGQERTMTLPLTRG